MVAAAGSAEKHAATGPLPSACLCIVFYCAIVHLRAIGWDDKVQTTRVLLLVLLCALQYQHSFVGSDTGLQALHTSIEVRATRMKSVRSQHFAFKKWLRLHCHIVRRHHVPALF